MKINLSLSIKLTLIVVLVSAIGIFSLTYVNIEQQSSFFEKSYTEKAIAFAHALDTTIEHYDELKEQEILQSYILHFIEINPEILKIDINLLEEETLKVLVSSDEESIGNTASKNNYLSYEEGMIINIPNHTDNSHTMTVITPINISGQRFGTYEILISMDSTYNVFNTHLRNLFLISIITLVVLILSFLFLLRKTIVKPIIEVKNAIKKIREGKLNTKIKIKSKDELGELSSVFNEMTADLEKFSSENLKYSHMLEGLIKQKDEFINQLGHDLRSPLNPLVNLLPLIKTEDSKSKDRLEIITRNVDYMENLVIKTLKLGQLNSEKIEFLIDDINLWDEINNVIIQNKFLFKKNNFQTSNKVNKKINVKADKLHLTELLNNLFSNAVKYSKKGGKIIIDAKDNKGFVTVSIKDTGIGMTQGQINHIFNEFYKADESRHDFTSTGLGLSISKRIVEKHGGKIWADSPGENKGSIFYFTIPSCSKKNIDDISQKVDNLLKDYLDDKKV